MSRPLAVEDLYAIRLAEDPQIAPDGERVAYVVTSIDRPTYEYRRAIWLAPVASGAPRQYTAGLNDASPRWSPDGRQIAFVRTPPHGTKPKNADERERGVGKPQIWVLPADGGEARQLTFARYGASTPTWSPDSETLVYVAATGEPDDPEAADAHLEGKDLPAVRTIDRVWYRADGEGWIYEHRSHLFRIPAAGGEPTQLTDGDWDDGLPAWSPDGRHLAFTSDRSDERWRWPGSDIWTLDLAAGELRRLTDESLSCGLPSWSPDGQTIVFAGAPRRAWGGHIDLYSVPTNGDAPASRFTTEFIPTCDDECIDDQRGGHGPSRIYWSADGTQIYFQASFRGTTQVYTGRPDGSDLVPITEGHHHVYSFSMDAARRVCALGISDPLTPGDLYVQHLDQSGKTRRLTEVNAELLREVALATPEALSFEGVDGWDLQGWVLRPAASDPGERLPAVLEVHGGPHAMYGSTFFFEFQLLAAAGYVVLYSNPRGSTGYGRHFSGAVTDDWGGKDYADLMAFTDAAIARGGIDPERMAVAGGSYGGYMTDWIVGHTDRFKAAVTMRSLNNWASFFGTSDIGPHFTLDQIHGTPWEQLDRLMHHSPIANVANIRTPLLILHSDEDLRCPIEQSEQLFTALKWLGRDVRLVIFEGQSHGLSRNGHPRSRVIRLQHILSWLATRVPAPVASESRVL